MRYTEKQEKTSGLAVAQQERNLRGIVKNRQKINANISKMSIDIQGHT
jgi:hypothetical protein